MTRRDDDSGTDDGGPDSGTRSGERERRRQLRKKIVSVAVVSAICLGVVVTRAMWQGRSALDDGDAALSRGEHREAIELWRRAARWYVPFAPHVGDAYDRLEELADTAAGQGDVDTALAGYRGVRSSILATRSVFVPQAHRLDRSNRRIAALMARQEAEAPNLMVDPAAPPGDPPASGAAGTEEWHYALLSRDEAPSVFWSIVALLGFAMWVSGGLLFALRGVSAEDKLVPRMAINAGVLIVIGLLVWMTGLYAA